MVTAIASGSMEAANRAATSVRRGGLGTKTGNASRMIMTREIVGPVVMVMVAGPANTWSAVAIAAASAIS